MFINKIIHNWLNQLHLFSTLCITFIYQNILIKYFCVVKLHVNQVSKNYVIPYFLLLIKFSMCVFILIHFHILLVEYHGPIPLNWPFHSLHPAELFGRRLCSTWGPIHPQLAACILSHDSDKHRTHCHTTDKHRTHCHMTLTNIGHTVIRLTNTGHTVTWLWQTQDTLS